MLLLFSVGLLACEAGAPPELPSEPPASTASPSRRERDRERAKQESEASAPPQPTSDAAPDDCPADMLLIDTSHCTDLQRRCEKDEYNKPNKITICHRFASAPGTCRSGERRQRFCIDRYEYPNREGARAPVMVDFHDAMHLCAEAGKRLCWESEWVSACEGPEKTPFPYGYERSPEACNIDNPFKKPSLKKIYDPNANVSSAELQRLDQGVPSGSKPGCKSGFGVFDQTGNADEWVMLEQKRGKGGWAGLKGGAWGHVRNACRPVTTSHAPEFTYYFVSFRCCADAKPASDGANVWKPPTLPTNPKPKSALSRGFTPR